MHLIHHHPTGTWETENESEPPKLIPLTVQQGERKTIPEGGGERVS